MKRPAGDSDRTSLKLVSISLDRDQLDRLDALASREERTRSNLARLLMKRALAAYEQTLGGN